MALPQVLDGLPGHPGRRERRATTTLRGHVTGPQQAKQAGASPRESGPVSAARPVAAGALVGGAAPQYASSMGPDSSNARDGSRDPSADSTSVDPDEEGRALLGDLTVGAVVDGKYRVDRVLGRGAMGVVVQATHLNLGVRVALKFLRYRAKAGVNDDFQTRFRREARVSAKLKNEHITRVIDVGVWRDHVPYMVMDYLEGTDLRDIIKASGPMPIGTAIDYAVQVCEGIAEAHAIGVVHRDLKPSNLFVTKRPDASELVKILDFGISKWSAGEAAVDELTQTGVVLGSPKYMAPEQLFGSSEVDARADVWSVGAILYEMLCGRPPFDLPSFTKICAELSTERPPPSLVARRADIPPELEAVVMKCFVRTPELRIANVAELAGDILDAVHAPFAETVRNKIAWTLEPKSSRDPMGASGGMSLQSASYGSILTQSGSRSAVPVPAAPTTEATGASPTSVSASRPPERRRWALWLVPMALLLVGGGVFLAMSGSKNGEPPPSKSAATAVTAPAPPPDPPTATVPPSAVAAVTPGPASATAAMTAAAASTSARSSPPTHVPQQGGWHPVPRPVPTSVAIAPTATPRRPSPHHPWPRRHRRPPPRSPIRSETASESPRRARRGLLSLGGDALGGPGERSGAPSPAGGKRHRRARPGRDALLHRPRHDGGGSLRRGVRKAPGRATASTPPPGPSSTSPSATRKRGRSRAPGGEFRDAQAEARRMSRPDREKLATDSLAAIEPELPFLAIDVPPLVRVIRGLEIQRNGVPLQSGAWDTELPVDPGEVEVIERAPGYKPRTLFVTVAAKQHATLAAVPLELAPLEATASLVLDRQAHDGTHHRPRGRRRGRSRRRVRGPRHQRQEEERRQLPYLRRRAAMPAGGVDAMNKANAEAWVSNIGFGVAAVAVGLGSYLFLSGGAKEQPAPTVSWGVSGGAGGAMGTLTGRF